MAASTSTDTPILAHSSWSCTASGSDKVYHLQLIGTPPGFQVVAQHGRRGASLRATSATLANISYKAALVAYTAAEEKRRSHDYTRDEDSVIPADAPYGTYFVMSDQDVTDYVKDHDAMNIPDPTRAARTKHQRERTAAPLSLLLSHPRAVIVDPNTTMLTVTKIGSVITVNSTDKNVIASARRAAMEIGGTITLDGLVGSDGIFLVTGASAPDLDALLARTRAHIMRRATDVPVARPTKELFAAYLLDDKAGPLAIRDANGDINNFDRSVVLDALEFLPDTFKDLPHS